MAQSTDINDVLNADEIQAKLRDKRLILEKLVKSEKEQIKQNAVMNARKEIQEYQAAQKYQVSVTEGLDLAVKSKRTLSSMNDAIFS